jgi:hypothetical protein
MNVLIDEPEKAKASKLVAILKLLPAVMLLLSMFCLFIFSITCFLLS